MMRTPRRQDANDGEGMLLLRDSISFKSGRRFLFSHEGTKTRRHEEELKQSLLRVFVSSCEILILSIRRIFGPEKFSALRLGGFAGASLNSPFPL